MPIAAPPNNVPPIIDPETLLFSTLDNDLIVLVVLLVSNTLLVSFGVLIDVFNTLVYKKYKIIPKIKIPITIIYNNICNIIKKIFFLKYLKIKLILIF